MSAVSRLKVALKELKEDYYNYMQGIDSEDYDKMKIYEHKVELNVKLIPKLIKTAYPENVYTDLKKEVGDIEGTEADELIVFTEALLVSNISTEKDVSELENQLERLAERLAMGEISEDAYNSSIQIIQGKIKRIIQSQI
jgi:hypothetical protein